MWKILTIARREYLAMVGTKAFLFSLAMMPVLMFGGIFIGGAVNNVSDVADKKIVILDQAGSLFDKLSETAEVRNRSIEQKRLHSETNDNARQMFVGSEPKYVLELKRVEEVTDEVRLELSDQIRSGQIDAFVEIPPGIMAMPGTAQDKPQVSFYSQESALSQSRDWLDRILNEIVKVQRFQDFGIDRDIVNRASQRVTVAGLGLFEQAQGGEIRSPDKKDEMLTVFLPFGIMMLMFMVIFLAAQPMLESVLEEKSDRVAEVLLGSANPFQLMLGKLLGNVGGSICIFAGYFAGAYFLAVYKGWVDFIPFEIAPWFVAFQVVGVLFFSSIFMAVGASVNQLKEAQSMLLPVWMVLMCPMFVWIHAIREPNGAIATWSSFFPPATPLMMILRLSTDTAIPVWQPIVGLLLLILATLLCVFFAGRIFRVGILWQGKTPKISQLIRWALVG